MRKIKLILFFVVVSLLPQLAMAQFTETKEITKKFKVSPQTQIEVSNKYGKIDVKTWDKDSIVFQINIRVEAKKLSKLEDLVRGIDFEVIQNQHYVTVGTTVEKNKSRFGKEFNRFKESLLKSDGNIQVDYSIWMPETNRLKLENKFGDIYLEDLYGDIEINLSNGNLKAHNFYGDATLTMSFSDASINSFNKGRLDCNFGEVYIKTANSLNISSKSSDFEINNIEMLTTQSRRDKFRIRKIDVLENKSNFSNFRIDELNDRLSFHSDYGSLDLENTANDFGTLLIESKSTDINLYFNENHSFPFSFTLNDVKTSYCDQVTIEHEEPIDDKGKQMKTEGYFGEQNHTTQKLVVNANSGELRIRKE